jgi:hypothetical protein
MRRLHLSTPIVLILTAACGDSTQNVNSTEGADDDLDGGSESDTDGLACTSGCLAPEAVLEFDVPIQGGLFVGDFDGNGVHDLASGAGIVLIRERGLDFEAPLDLQTNDDQILRFVADLDGDGRSDLLGKHVVDSTLLVFLADEQSGFEPLETVALSSTHGPNGIDLFAEDFDGDGRDEVAVFTDSGRTLDILRREAEGDWTTMQTFTSVSERWVLTGGLVDDDEHVDLVAVLGAEAQVHLGRGDGTFVAPENFLAGADAIGAPFASPVDAGLRGVAYTGNVGTLSNFTAGVVTLWSDDERGMTGAGFETPWPTDALAIGDLHGDGFGDVVVVTDNGVGQPALVVLCGTENDYGECDLRTLPERPDTIAMLDIDGNGMDDIVYGTEEQDRTLHVLFSRA